MIEKMLQIIALRHAGQVCKGGKPYVMHCLKVAALLDTTDEELLCIALGHDLIEDTFAATTGSAMGEGVHYLTQKGISARVIVGIAALTRIEGETRTEYKARVMGNRDAIRVKVADLTHNLDTTRLQAPLTEKDLKRLNYYRQFLRELIEAQDKEKSK